MGLDVGAGEPPLPPPDRVRTGGPPGREGDGAHRRAWRVLPRLSPVTVLVAVIPGVLGLITGGYQVNVPPLWGDEGVTKMMAARSAGQILATLPHNDVVHGAYYLVIHAMTEIAGSSSPTVLRSPSVLAMAVAAAFTALLARRLATLAASPYPAVTGLFAGVLFALLPGVVDYAQEARSYAIVTMLAAITTYLLIKAACEGGRWWIGYGVAAALTGLFNIFGLLLLLAHGLSLLIAGRGAPGVSGVPALRGLQGRRVIGLPAAWLLAAAGAVVALTPLIAYAYTERGALAWLTGVPSIGFATVSLADFWAGSARLVWPVFCLSALGLAADAATWRRRRPITPGSIALPWLVIPPAVLLVASQVTPVYDGRYVVYCLPAVAIAVAWGLTWLARAAAAVLPARQGRLAWLLPVAIMVPLAISLIPPGARTRLPSSRPDNLLGDSQIVAANARPGDIVFFIPVSFRPIEVEYPAQWRQVRDIAQAVSPTASNTLYGIDVSPAELLERFTNVTRVWLYSTPEIDSYLSSARATPLDKAEAFLLSRLQLVRRWRDGDHMLTLYQVRR